MPDPEYAVITRAPHFVEVRLTHQTRRVLDAMKADFLRWYTENGGADRPYVRALFDVSALFGPSPYSAKVFQEIAQSTPYNTQNIRVAALTKNASVFTFFSYINPLQSVLRLFTVRDEAILWLNDGLTS